MMVAPVKFQHDNLFLFIKLLVIALLIKGKDLQRFNLFILSAVFTGDLIVLEQTLQLEVLQTVLNI